MITHLISSRYGYSSGVQKVLPKTNDSFIVVAIGEFRLTQQFSKM